LKIYGILSFLIFVLAVFLEDAKIAVSSSTKMKIEE